MSQYILDFFETPIVLDPNLQRKAKTLNSIWLTGWILIFSYIIISLFISKNLVYDLIISIIFLCCLGFVGYVKNEGLISQASLILVPSLWIILSILALYSGGILNVNSSLYISLAIVTGFLLGKKAMIIISLLSIGFEVFYILVTTYIFQFPPLLYNSSFNLFILSFSFLFTIVPLYFNLTDLESSLKVSQESELKYNQLNENIEHLVSLRTENLTNSSSELEFFVMAICYNLINPLDSIKDHTSMILGNKDIFVPKFILDSIRKIIADTERVDVFISDLSNFSKLISKPIVKNESDMNKIVKKTIDLFKNDINNFSITVTCENLSSDTPFDPVLINQVWTNLFSNAIKLSKKINHPVIDIGTHRENDKTTYFISDNGIGLDLKNETKSSNGSSRKYDEGELAELGVVLALTKSIITRHGGTFWATSEPKKGSIFYFNL